MHGAPVHLKRPQALGHHRHGIDMPALGAYPYLFPRGDAQLASQHLADLDELFRLDDGIEQHVGRPVVEVFGEAVGGRRIRKLLERTEGVAIFGEDARHRVVIGQRVVRMQRVVRNRRFQRLVVFGERPLAQPLAGEEVPGAALGEDERLDVVFRRRGHRVVRHIGTDPAFTVPPHQCAVRVPRRAVRAGRGAVVENPPVQRPGPGPAEGDADVVRVGIVAPIHHVALLGPGTGVDPATAGGRAVGTQLAEIVEQLALAADDPPLVLDVRQRAAVVFLGQFGRGGMRRVAVVPGQVEDRLGKSAALLLIELLQAMEQPSQDRGVSLRLARRWCRLMVPLQPARAVGDRAIVFGEGGGRQTEHRGLDLARIDVVEFAVVLPELAGLGGQRVHDHQPLELRQPFQHLGLVRERREDIEALTESAGHLALGHVVDRVEHVVQRLGQLGQPVVAPVVIGSCRLAIERLHHADEEALVVLPVRHLIGQQRLADLLADVVLVALGASRRQRHVARQQIGQQADVGQPLDVGMPAQRIDPAAGHAHVAQQQLDHGAGADHLRANGMLRPAQSVEDGHGLVRRRALRQQVPELQDLGLRHAADALDHLHRVAAVVLAHQLEHAARVLQCLVAADEALLVEVEVPGGLVVLVALLVVAAEQPVVELEAFAHQVRRVGVMQNVFVGVAVILDQVADQPAKEDDIGPGTDPGVVVRHRRGAVVARVNGNQDRIAALLGLHDPAEAHRMRLGRVPAHGQDNIGIADVDPAVGHGTATE